MSASSKNWYSAGYTVAIRTAKEKAPDHDSQGLLYSGAGEMNRTPDLLITNELLYRLSYTGNACDYSPM